MRKFTFWALVLTLGIMISADVAQAQNVAPASSGLNIAILDLASIRRQAKVVKSVRQQLTAYQDGFRTSIQKEDAALKAANQELAKKRTLLSPEAFAQERRAFEQKVAAVQKLVQSSKKALDQVQAKAMLEVEKSLNKIITGIAEKNNLNLILRRDVTILASRSLEITASVLEALNKELPSVKVEKPVIK